MGENVVRLQVVKAEEGGSGVAAEASERAKFSRKKQATQCGPARFGKRFHTGCGSALGRRVRAGVVTVDGMFSTFSRYVYCG